MKRKSIENKFTQLLVSIATWRSITTIQVLDIVAPNIQISTALSQNAYNDIKNITTL